MTATNEKYGSLGFRARLSHPASLAVFSWGTSIPAVTRVSCFVKAELSQFFGPFAHAKRSLVTSVKSQPHNHHNRDSLPTKTTSRPCEWFQTVRVVYDLPNGELRDRLVAPPCWIRCDPSPT